MGRHQLVSTGVTVIVVAILVVSGIGTGVVSPKTLAEKNYLDEPSSSSYSNSNGKAQAPAVLLPQDIVFDNGNNYEIKIHDEDNGGTITVTPPISGTAVKGDRLVLNLPEPGEIDGDYSFWLQGESLSTDGPVDATISVEGDVGTSGVVNLSVSFVDAQTGETVFQTETQPQIIKYQEAVTQDSTSGTIELAVNRSGLPKGTTLSGSVFSANVTFSGDTGDKTSINFTYDSQRNAFVGTFDAAEVAGGNYSLDLTGQTPFGTSFEHIANEEDIEVEASDDSSGSDDGSESDDGDSSSDSETSDPLQLAVKNASTTPNSTVTVEFNLTNTNGTTLSGPVLEVTDFPSGWTVTDHSNAGASYSDSPPTFLWLQVSAGDSKHPSVTFEVPNSTEPDDYTVTAKASTAGDFAINRTGTITVNEGGTKTIDEAIAGEDGTIDIPEIQQAIQYWANNETVPNTGGQTIGIVKIQALIQQWASGG